MTKEQYIIFLSEIYTKRDGSHLSASSVSHYGDEALRKINYFIKKSYPEYESVFDITSFSRLIRIKDSIFKDPEFVDLDSRGNNMYSAGFNRYMEFAGGSQFVRKEKSLPLLDAREPVKYSTLVQDKQIPTRDRIKILQVEQACNYNCQIDTSHKSFISRTTGYPYMEGHHIIPLNQQNDFQYSLDCYANIIVLCPTCHRFMHYGMAYEQREKLISIYEERAERFSNCGILIVRPEFLDRAEATSHFYTS